MANHNDRILRFHVADKVFHGLNAILWFALVITGAIVYLCKPEAATGESLMAWHVGLGIVFTLNLVGYLLFAPERFALMINACLIWDKNTILWFRNFGGYPRRFFKIPFGPVEVTPQGPLQRRPESFLPALHRCHRDAHRHRLAAVGVRSGHR